MYNVYILCRMCIDNCKYVLKSTQCELEYFFPPCHSISLHNLISERICFVFIVWVDYLGTSYSLIYCFKASRFTVLNMKKKLCWCRFQLELNLYIISCVASLPFINPLPWPCGITLPETACHRGIFAFSFMSTVNSVILLLLDTEFFNTVFSVSQSPDSGPHPEGIQSGFRTRLYFIFQEF